jgi:hypothetical protein
MHANNVIPLASDLLPFPGQMRREDHVKSASLPDRLSSSGRSVILGTVSQKCPAALTALWIRSPRVVADQQDEFCGVYPRAQKLGPRSGRMYAGHGFN